MTEHLLLNRTFERTLDQVREQLLGAEPRPRQARIWLFEDVTARRALAAELAAHGIEAQVHSAYKPLVHFFLDEVDTSGLAAVDITYPVLPECVPTRFRLEAYPLAEMLPRAELTFRPGPCSADEDEAGVGYQVTLHYGSRQQTHFVFAPNCLRRDLLDQTACIPCAWLMTNHEGHWIHAPLEAEYLQCYEAAIQAVTTHEWREEEPYFDRLVIRAALPGIERDLVVGHETLSTTEAMHEDLYFSLLEFFQRYSGRPLGDRGLQPGQIVPDIRCNDSGQAWLKVHYEPATAVQDETSVPVAGMQADNRILPALATVDLPLSFRQIRSATEQFRGDHFMFASRQNRQVHGVHIQGGKPAVLISGGQHANETTGVVGALRAADRLRGEPDANLVLMPLENPDGYALHQTLREHNPRHMHHAARYSALGDDIEYRRQPPWLERRARRHAFAVSEAGLHVNLHGYPAHEWTRPCTGYLPRGFEIWSIPKGFFLILRYRPACRDKARALLAHVTGVLATNSALMAYNRRQLKTYRQHAGDMPFPVLDGIPYLEAAVDDMPCDVTLVTEFPDETIYGEAFVFGHTVQMETVLAATRWWWEQGA